MMRLVNIFYEPFASDAYRLDNYPSDSIHELDRQIRLTDDVNRKWYISWGKVARLAGYDIGFSETSFFIPKDYPERDMTHSAMWTGLSGNEVTIQHVDWQQIEIRAGTNAVYCYTGGNDVIYVSRQSIKEPL